MPFTNCAICDGYVGSIATLKIGTAAYCISLNDGQATVLLSVAVFNTCSSKPPIPENQQCF